MRNLIFILLSFLCLNAFGQNYLNETARWAQSYHYTGFTNTSSCITTLFFEGDSMHNSKNYFLLYDSTVCYLTSTEYDSLFEPYLVYDTNVTVYLRKVIREENKKIISLEPNELEYVFYNFGLPDFTVIDSVAINSTCFGSQVSILNHDTVCIGNIGRKRWRVSMSQYPLAQYFIEGVGPSSGFLAPVCRNGCPECGYTLNSFVLNGDTLYHGTCSIVANVEEIEKEMKWIQTPESLIFEGGFFEQISIYNLNLQLVATSKYSASKMTFDVSTYQNGVYLFSGIFEGKPINGKFLVIR